MDWFKKHVDMVTVVSAIIFSMVWMNTKFNDVDKRFNELEKDIAVIKTVLIMKNIMPIEFAKSEENKQ
jgi:hypothetical protein